MRSSHPFKDAHEGYFIAQADGDRDRPGGALVKSLQSAQAELDSAAWESAAAEWSYEVPTVPEGRLAMAEIVWGPGACAAVDAVDLADSAWAVRS